MPCINIANIRIPKDLVSLIPKDVALRYGVVLADDLVAPQHDLAARREEAVPEERQALAQRVAPDDEAREPAVEVGAEVRGVAEDLRAQVST